LRCYRWAGPKVERAGQTLIDEPNQIESLDTSLMGLELCYKLRMKFDIYDNNL